MSKLMLPLALLLLGGVAGAARRWIPRSGWYAIALCGLPLLGFWLASVYC